MLSLLKRVVKGILHQATEEWLREIGVPIELIEAECRQREHVASLAVARSDALAVQRLGVDDDGNAPADIPALPPPSTAPAKEPRRKERPCTKGS